MVWPIDDLTKNFLDAGTKDPSQARAELENLLDKVKLILAEDVALRDENNNFTGAQRITNTAPTLFLNETGVAADSGKYYFQADSTDLTLFLMNDVETASTPVMQFARTGINSDAIDFTADNFRINGKEVVADNTSNIVGYKPLKRVSVRANTTQLIPSFNVLTTVAEATWETVSDTSSGAANIWSDLDALPDNIDYIEVNCHLTVNYSNTTALSMALYVRVPSSGMLPLPGARIGIIEQGTPTGGYRVTQDSLVKIPVTNKIFEVYWDDNSNGNLISRELIMSLKGYG